MTERECDGDEDAARFADVKKKIEIKKPGRAGTSFRALGHLQDGSLVDPSILHVRDYICKSRTSIMMSVKIGEVRLWTEHLVYGEEYYGKYYND